MNGNQHLYLTGYRGTGKSAVGVVLARRLDRPVIDLDQIIEANAGKSIREIFDAGGESMFRALETESLSAVAQSDPAVISLGGGTILSAQNREVIKNTGVCVWLKATAETIAQRINTDSSSVANRPPLTPLDQLAEIRHLLESRQPLYEAVSNHHIDTEGKSFERVADQLIEWLSTPSGTKNPR